MKKERLARLDCRFHVSDCLQVYCRFFATLLQVICFLVACTRLYTSLCRLVSRSVGPSIITSRFWAFRAKGRADFSYCPCPATILPLPTRTRLMLPCIRPCLEMPVGQTDGQTDGQTEGQENTKANSKQGCIHGSISCVRLGRGSMVAGQGQ